MLEYFSTLFGGIYAVHVNPERMRSHVSSHKYKPLQDRLFCDQKNVPKLIFTFFPRKKKDIYGDEIFRLFIS